MQQVAQSPQQLENSDMNGQIKWHTFAQMCNFALASSIAFASDPLLHFPHTEYTADNYSTESPVLIDEIVNGSKKAEEMTAMAGWRIVYHGTEEFKQRMFSFGSVKGSGSLKERDSNQIIIVESADHDQELFERLLARGNFIISIGGASIDSARNALDAVVTLDAGLDLKETENKAPKNRFKASSGDGKVVFGKVSAYRFSPRGSDSFETAEQNEAVAVAEAIAWASDLIIKDRLPIATTAEKGTVLHNRNKTANCGTSKLVLKSQYSKESDSNTSYDYWTIKHVTSVVPGANYKNYSISNILDADNGNNSWELLDYDPTTTTGSSSSTAQVTFTNAAVGGSINWTYSIPDVSVVDSSLIGDEIMLLDHYILSSSTVANTTYTIKPGSFVRVHQGATNIWNSVFEGAHARFKRRYHSDHTCNISFN